MPAKTARTVSTPAPAKPAYRGKPRGFAVISAKRRSEIARMGGEAVSVNRRHMARIGAIGGTAGWAKRRAGKPTAARKGAA